MCLTQSESMIEQKKPHEFANQLFEARHGLRTYETVDLVLLELTALLPEDDFCHFAREALQLGAGLAGLWHDEQITDMEDVFEAFFATQPINRYRDAEERTLERKLIVSEVLRSLETEAVPENHPTLDPFIIEAAAAFFRGYAVTAHILKTNP